MNFGIFFGLIGVPLGILIISILCYVLQGKRDQEEQVKIEEQKEVNV